MKLYEKLGINFSTIEGIEKLVRLNCEDLEDEYSGENHPCKYCEDISGAMCPRCIAERLFEEVCLEHCMRKEND